MYDIVRYNPINQFHPFQSAYRKYNSTETAVLLTLDNTFHSIDQGMSTVLVFLDLSAAFDTIDNSILLNRLQSSFGIHDTALSWFHSYLSNRTQFLQIGNSRSSISHCPTGVPQGSLLGPMLFSLYTSPIAHIVSIPRIKTVIGSRAFRSAAPYGIVR